MNKKDNSAKEIKTYEPEKDHFKIEFDNISFCVSRNGGRIISFKMGEQEILTQPKEHPMHGSTFWPDPQSTWNWPPPPILDSIPYEGGITGNTIQLFSMNDKENGFQFGKVFSVNDYKSIQISYRITNISEESKNVGPWEITRVPSGGISFFLQGIPASLPKSDLDNVIVENGIVWFQPDKVAFEGGKKFFSTVKEGWLAYRLNEILFVKKFSHIDAKHIAPGQGEVEIYEHGDKSYIELENHGEHRTLLSGESIEYNVRWFLKEFSKENNIPLRKEKMIDEVRALIN
jgi:hypothetical protein